MQSYITSFYANLKSMTFKQNLCYAFGINESINLWLYLTILTHTYMHIFSPLYLQFPDSKFQQKGNNHWIQIASKWEVHIPIKVRSDFIKKKMSFSQ